MTQDVIALTPRMPSPEELLAALHAGGPDLRVRQSGGGAVAHLCTDRGQTLVSLEAPRLIQVPGETARLLGPTAPKNSPVWWTEARATNGVEGAGRLAGSAAGRLAVLLSGSTWPDTVAHTDVVTVPPYEEAENATGHPGVDMLTDKAAIVIQERPVIASTTWLTDIIRTVAHAERELCIVTPPGTRLTHPTRTVLQRVPARWIVTDPQCGYYDGLTGAVLRWHDGHFAPGSAADAGLRIADAFRSDPVLLTERQLHISLRTIHPATKNLVLGEALSDAWLLLTGSLPAGWGTAEPAGSPWSPRQLTDLARARARQAQPTWLVAVGAPDRPAIATLRISHSRVGVEEHVTLAIGYAAGEGVPVSVLPELASVLATRHNLATMVTELRVARADLTTPATYEPPPIPLSLTLGSDAVAGLGAACSRGALAETSRTRLGASGRPTLHYDLGDGTDPAARQQLGRLIDQLNRFGL